MLSWNTCLKPERAWGRLLSRSYVTALGNCKGSKGRRSGFSGFYHFFYILIKKHPSYLFYTHGFRIRFYLTKQSHKQLSKKTNRKLRTQDVCWASQVVLVVKNLPANAGDKRDPGSIPGRGKSPGGGHGNPLQYACLEHPMDRGTWRATAHGVAKSRTWLKWLSTHARGLWAVWDHSYYGSSCSDLNLTTPNLMCGSVFLHTILLFHKGGVRESHTLCFLSKDIYIKFSCQIG